MTAATDPWRVHSAGPAGSAPEPPRPPGRPTVAVHQNDVDGVPVLWTRSRGPVLTARLRFRLGTVDETPRTRGAVHLLTHCLVARAGGTARGALDGDVGPLVTDLTITGTPDDVVIRLRALCLAAAQTFAGEVVDRERGVVLTEGDHVSVPSTTGAVLAVTRFGFGPFGMHAMREVGLWGVGPGDLAALAAAHLTRGNAVLELDGDLPAGLRLPLPDGVAARVPAVPPPAVARSWVARDGGRVAWMGVVPDRPAFTAVASVVRDELVRRIPRGVAAPTAVLERLAPGRLRLLVEAGVDAASGELVRDTLLDVLPALAGQAGEPELARLADRCRELLATATDPMAQISQASTSMLLGETPRSARARLHDLVMVTPTQLRDAAAATWEDLTVLVPRALPLRRADIAPHDLGDRPPLPGPATPVVPAVPDVHGSRLVVTEEAVQLRGPDRGRQDRWTVPWSRCVGMLAWPDGRRDVLGEDGTTVSVEPAMWCEGSRVVAVLDDLVPADRVAWQPARAPGSGEPVTVGEPGGLWALMALTALAWVSGLAYAAYWARQGAWAVLEHLPAELLVVGGAALVGTAFQVQVLWRERRRRRLPPLRLGRTG